MTINTISHVTHSNNESLRRTHLYLNNIYYNLMFGEDVRSRLSDDAHSKFKAIETRWYEGEMRRCLNQYSCNVIINSENVVRAAMRKHKVFNHPIFDYLMNNAGMDELKGFIKSESILNLEFFDYLALAIIGTTNQAKSEIAANLWDEAGRGVVDKFHTVLFKRLMDDLGIEYSRDNILSSMSWEGVAGINLFNYFAIYPFNKMKYFGMLAATEMLDPDHYNKLIKGINRLCAGKNINHEYYVEHESLDVEHANGWLRNVIMPILADNPKKTQDFWIGFYLRLDSAQQYYDNLYYTLTMKNAA